MVGGINGQMQGDDGVTTEHISKGMVIVPGLSVSGTIPFILFASDSIDVHLVGRGDGQVEGDHAVAAVSRREGFGIDACIGIDAVAPDILATNVDVDFICDLGSYI